MQLLFLTPYVANPPRHGGGLRTRQLLKAAVEAGHRTVNFALAADADEAAGAAGLAAEGIETRAVVVPPFGDSLSTGQRMSKWLRLLAGRSSLLPRRRDAAAAVVLQNLVRENRFDLVVVDSPWMSVYLPECRRLKYVASTHNVEGDVLAASAVALDPAAAWAGKRDATILLRHETRWAHRAEAVITVSEDDARRFAALSHGARTVVAPNGVDVEALRLLPPAPADGPLLFVASFDYPPNLDGARWFLQRILPDIRSAVGPVPAVLAGREPSPALRAEAAAVSVSVTGYVPDLAPHYAAAGVAVVPLRFGGGSRLKILEAFALGRPVISTRAGASGLAVKDGVELLIADEGPAFAAALRRLRSDPALGPRLVAAARAFVEARHGWPMIRRTFAGALEAAYRCS